MPIPAGTAIRVGIIMPEDRIERLRLALPAAAYRLTDGGHNSSDLRGGVLDCTADGQAVRLARSGVAAERSAEWALAPLESPRPDDDPGGGPAVAVDGIVAGRGFHWHTTTRQTLPGELSLRAVDGCLVLVNRLGLEDYLCGVITSEMSGQCPVAFLQAQCVVARSWTVAHRERKHDDLGIHYCNDDCCQRYQGNSDLTPAAVEAVRSTAGVILRANDGTVVDANYSKSCGGVVETPEAVWGLSRAGLSALVDAPPVTPPLAAGNTGRFWPVTEANIDEFLTGSWLGECDAYCGPKFVDESAVGQYLGRVDQGGGFFRWTTSYDADQLAELIRESAEPGDPLAKLAEMHDLAVTRRGVSGRALAVDATYLDNRGQPTTSTINDQYRIRQTLHPSFLYSSAFVVRVNRNTGGRATRFTFDGAGWGHGAGLCQIGALGMGLAGLDHRQILSHYFPSATAEDLVS
ncbi:MAG: SpoIID/LytB domain-containing protein [bacterium]|nr:SpoIID/LytB domain-containing protein [bacterium]